MTEAGLGFGGALAAAYRRAVRLGLPAVGTDLVLWSALCRAPALGVWRPDLADPALRRVRRGRAGLVDPDPPPQRSRLAPRFDEEIAHLTDAELRLAAYHGADRVRGRVARTGETPPPLPAFTPAVRHAVYEGLHEGGRAGLSHVGPAHLLLGLLSVPDSAAVRLLAEVTGTPAHRGSALAETIRRGARDRPVEPRETAADVLSMLRVLKPEGPPTRLEPLLRLGIRLLTEAYLARPYRRHGARYGHPMLWFVEQHATLVAVRAGHDAVSSAHVLVALLEMHDELVRDGRPVRSDIHRVNKGGGLLVAHGMDAAAAARELADLPVESTERRIDEVPRQGWRDPGPVVGAPAQGRSALIALRGASLLARRRGDPYAGTSHLVVELSADPAGPAAELIRRLGADPAAIHAAALATLPATAH